jgi:DHA1 family multidrug resistance protein-like MFS transporter
MRYLLASTFIVSISMGIVGLALPLYALDLGADYTTIGLLGTTYVAFNCLFSPLAGRFSDRKGRKPFLVLGLFLLAFSFILYPLIRSVWWLLGVRLLQGAAEAPIWVNAQAAMADLSRVEKRGRAMGIYGTSWAFGFAIGPSIGGYLYNIKNAHLIFTLAAFIALIAALTMSATRVPKPHVAPRRVKLGELGPACFLGFIYVGVVSVIFTLFQVYASKNLGMTAAEIGSLISLFAVVRGLLFIPVGNLSDKYGPKRIIRLGLFGLVVTWAGLVVMTNYFLLIPVIVGLAAAAGSIYPAVMSMVSKIGGQTSAYLLGIFNGVTVLGWAVMPPIGGFLADAVAPTVPYLMSALISFVALIMLRKILVK